MAYGAFLSKLSYFNTNVKLTPKYWRLTQLKCEDFLICTKMRLAAGLHPEPLVPLGSSQRSPRPPSCVWGRVGATRKGKGKGKGEKGRQRGRERNGKEGERKGGRREGKGREGSVPLQFLLVPPLSNSWRRPCLEPLKTTKLQS